MRLITHRLIGRIENYTFYKKKIKGTISPWVKSLASKDRSATTYTYRI